MTSIILAAVIWDAEDPCSVKLHKTQNLLYNITAEYNSTFIFWCFTSNSAFFRWHRSINDAKWTVAPDVLASSITSFLLLTFVKFHAENLTIFSLLCHRCFCCENFHSLRHRNKFVNRIIDVLWWIFTFSCNMVFMMWRYRVSNTYSCGFISFQNARKICFNFVGSLTPTILHNFTRHSRSHWCFKLLTRVLDGLVEFLIIRVDEIDPSQLSCVFKMELLIRPLLLFLQHGVLFPLFSRSLATNDPAWMSDVFSLISPRTMYIRQELFHRVE